MASDKVCPTCDGGGIKRTVNEYVGSRVIPCPDCAGKAAEQVGVSGKIDASFLVKGAENSLERQANWLTEIEQLRDSTLTDAEQDALHAAFTEAHNGNPFGSDELREASLVWAFGTLLWMRAREHYQSSPLPEGK